MMRRTLVFVTTLLILATVATAARAQLSGRPQMTRSDRWDFSIQTRYTSSQDYVGDGGSSLHIQEDLGWGFGFSYNFNQHFNLGMLFTWRSVPFESVAIDVDDPGNTNRYSGQMSTSTFGVSGEYNVLKGRFTPYVNGSMGWLHVNTNIFAGWTSGCWWDPWWGYICSPFYSAYSDTNFSWNVGAGLRYDFSRDMFVRGGYELNTIDGNSGADPTFDAFRIELGWKF